MRPAPDINQQGVITTRHIIHGGRHEIGGMCIEVAPHDGTRILLGLGMPLTAPNGADFPRDTPQRPTADLIAEGVLRDVPGVFPHDATAPDVAAIILTHAHLGHYDLAHHAHPAIPVYGSDGTISVEDEHPLAQPEVNDASVSRANLRLTSDGNNRR